MSGQDEIILGCEIAALSREEVLRQLQHFKGAVRLDFTSEFLARQPLDQLRHILLAARLYIRPAAAV